MTTAPTWATHPYDTRSDLEPFCSEEQFTELLEGMVAELAPRLFAVVQERGERADARIAACGIAFDDHAEVSGVDGGPTMRLRTPDGALRPFAWGSDITSRLVWVDPHAATPSEDDDAEPR